jgi:hypothetical protein
MVPWLTLQLPPELPFSVNKYTAPGKLYVLFAYSLFFLAFLILFLGFLKASNWIPATISNGNGTGGMFTVASRKSRNGFQFCAVTGDPGSRNVSDVNFPSDYTELLTQVISGELEILENR